MVTGLGPPQSSTTTETRIEVAEQKSAEKLLHNKHPLTVNDQTN